MEIHIILLILLAACMHASWHALVKIGENRFLTYSLINIVAFMFSSVVLFVIPSPFLISWKYLLFSSLVHHLYKISLLITYHYGDLSKTFPIARGTAPFFVAIGSVLFAGDSLEKSQLLTLALICSGIIILGIEKHQSKHDVILAIITGIITSIYTVIDGIGARASLNTYAFIAWIYVLDGIPFPLAAIVMKRMQFFHFFKKNWKPAISAGLMSVLSYGIVVWALSLENMYSVAALREISVVVAAILGTVCLGEPFGLRRIISASLVTAGIMFLTIS